MFYKDPFKINLLPCLNDKQNFYQRNFEDKKSEFIENKGFIPSAHVMKFINIIFSNSSQIPKTLDFS
jgi:hypothetical protein